MSLGGGTFRSLLAAFRRPPNARPPQRAARPLSVEGRPKVVAGRPQLGTKWSIFCFFLRRPQLVALQLVNLPARPEHLRLAVSTCQAATHDKQPQESPTEPRKAKGGVFGPLAARAFRLGLWALFWGRQRRASASGIGRRIDHRMDERGASRSRESGWRAEPARD